MPKSPSRTRWPTKKTQLVTQLHDVFFGQGTTLQPFGQRLTFDVVHDVVVESVRLAGAVHGHHVRMIESGEDASFPEESFCRRSRSVFGSENLDGDVTLQGHVTSEKDRPHPTGTELTLDVILVG